MSEASAEPRTGRRSPLLPLSRRATFAVVVGLVLLAGLWAIDAKTLLSDFLRWLHELGPLGVPLFLVLHTVAIVLLFPGVLFPLGAGFLYGPVLGTLISTLGKTLGATVAFLVARYLLDDSDTGSDRRGRRAERVRRFKRKHPKLRLLDRRLPEGGWRIVALIRMVPVIPFKLSNYFFGWSRFRRRDFVLGTFVGCLPYSLTNAWIGSLAADLGTLGDRALPRSPLEWVLYAGGLALTLTAAALITKRARRILTEDPSTEPGLDGSAIDR